MNDIAREYNRFDKENGSAIRGYLDSLPKEEAKAIRERTRAKIAERNKNNG